MWELTISRGALLPVLVMLLGALPVGISTIAEPMDCLSWQPYEIFDYADREASLQIIKSVPVSHYEYKSDRGQGRRVLGVLPSELEVLLPESVTRLTTVNGSSMALKGLPSVDWSLLFMHSVVATQGLHQILESANSSLLALEKNVIDAEALLHFAISQISSQYISSAMLSVEVKKAEGQARLTRTKIERENTRMQWELEEVQLKLRQTSSTAKHINNLDMELLNKTAASEIETKAKAANLSKDSVEDLNFIRRNVSIALIEKEAELKSKIEAIRLEKKLDELKKQSVAQQEDSRIAAAEEHRLDETMWKGNRKLHSETVVTILEQCTYSTMDLIFSNGGIKIGTAILGLLIGITIIGHGIKLASIALFRYTSCPPLVRETSMGWGRRRSKWDFKLKQKQLYKMVKVNGNDSTTSRGDLEGIILTPSIAEQVTCIVRDISAARERGGELQNILLTGPPGTGKSLLAKRIAVLCGLEYAIISGGDVGSLGNAAALEVHQLFSWARSSQGGGLLLLVDEADAMSQQTSATAALLFNTGLSHPDFMMILATNSPQELHAGLLDHMDHTIDLDLPDFKARESLCKLYYERHIVSYTATAAWALEYKALGGFRLIWQHYGSRCHICCPIQFEEDFDIAKRTQYKYKTHIDRHLAASSEGLSGRQLHKLIISIQVTALGTTDGILTQQIWKAVVERRLSKISAAKHGGEKIGREIGLISALSPGNKNIIRGNHHQPEFVNSDSGRGSSSLGSSTYPQPNHELLYVGG